METQTRTIRVAPPDIQQQAAKALSLADITSEGSTLPNRYMLHGPDGSGKTSFAAHSPNPIFLQIQGETGLETLIKAGQLPKTAHFPAIHKWLDLLGVIETLRADEHEFQTLVIDTMNGAESLCHEYVCQKEYSGNWGKEGFEGYKRGYEVALPVWTKLLIALDRLRAERKMMIFGLLHTRIRTFANPEGVDYDRYRPAMHDKTWELTSRWSDVILFLNFETFLDEHNTAKKGKATGGQERVLYTERHAAYDAKNRLGLPPEIPMGNSGKEAWKNFSKADAESNGKENK